MMSPALHDCAMLRPRTTVIVSPDSACGTTPALDKALAAGRVEQLRIEKSRALLLRQLKRLRFAFVFNVRDGDASEANRFFPPVSRSSLIVPFVLESGLAHSLPNPRRSVGGCCVHRVSTSTSSVWTSRSDASSPVCVCTCTSTAITGLLFAGVGVVPIAFVALIVHSEWSGRNLTAPSALIFRAQRSPATPVFFDEGNRSAVQHSQWCCIPN